MKHRKVWRSLGRHSKHRWAMLRTMVSQLIEYERIYTTLPKAKELRVLADQVVTLAKKGDEPAKARAGAILRGPVIVAKLFTELAHRYRLREGGYTRILRAGKRHGDAAQMAFIEYIDRPGEMRAPRPPQMTEPAGTRGILDALGD